MFRFFWYTLLCSLAMEASEFFSWGALDFDAHQTWTALGGAAILHISHSFHKKKRLKPPADAVLPPAAPPDSRLGALLAMIRAHTLFSSKNGVSCQRFSFGSSATYNFYSTGELTPFLALVYDHASRAASVRKTPFSALDPQWLSVQASLLALVEQREQGGGGTTACAEGVSADNEMERRGGHLLARFRELAAQQNYLESDEVYKLTETYRQDVERALSLYRSFDASMKTAHDPRFFEMFTVLESYADTIQQAIYTRQEQALQKLDHLIKKRGQ